MAAGGSAPRPPQPPAAGGFAATPPVGAPLLPNPGCATGKAYEVLPPPPPPPPEILGWLRHWTLLLLFSVLFKQATLS